MAKKKTASRTRAAKKKKAKRASPKSTTIHVLTDGTGGLPRHFLAAILSQFPENTEPPKYHVFCELDRIEHIMTKKVKAKSIVLHAFTGQASKDRLEEIAAKRSIPTYDITGGAMSFLAENTGWEAINDLERVHAHDSAYFDRIDAWEFTMQHDDSRRLESLGDADIVLVGISRVSKTPTSAYLGWLGHRVANVSFVPESGLPDEAIKARSKIVALTMQPRRLSEIRNRRMNVNGFNSQERSDLPELRYAGLRDTIREVSAAEQIYRNLKLPVVDVTDATVEETAARVLEMLKLG